VRLKCFGEVKILRVFVPDGTAEYWATSLDRMSKGQREGVAKSGWWIKMYHRGLKQQCLIEHAQSLRLRPMLNHMGCVSERLCGWKVIAIEKK